MTEAWQRYGLPAKCKNIANVCRWCPCLTTEAFIENVTHAHLQVAVWKNVFETEPPKMDLTAFGWDFEVDLLLPTVVQTDIPVTPREFLKLVPCNCNSDLLCSTQGCGCNSANTKCSLFCSCQGGEICFCNRTRKALQVDDEEFDYVLELVVFIIESRSRNRQL